MKNGKKWKIILMLLGMVLIGIPAQAQQSGSTKLMVVVPEQTEETEETETEETETEETELEETSETDSDRDPDQKPSKENEEAGGEGETDKTSGAAKTGDQSPVEWLLLLLGVSAAMLAGSLYRKQDCNHRE